MGAGALAAGAAGLVGSFVGQGEELRRLWAAAELRADGSAAIAEVIDYDFGIVSKHGIFRVVPGLDPQAPIQVTSPDAPDGVLVTTEPAGTRIRIGDPNTTISGEHRYEIDYPLDGVVVDGALAWDAVGTAWEVTIVSAEIHVVADREFVDPVCQQGATGSVDPCAVEQVEPGHLVATAEDLASGEGVTIRGSLGAALTAAPAIPTPGALAGDEDVDAGLALFGAGVGALVAAAPVSRLIRRAGREQVWPGGAADAAFGGGGDGGDGQRPLRIDSHELHRLATTEFAPPRDLQPSQGGILLAERVLDEHKVAWLIDVAGDRYVDLEGDKTLVRRPPPEDNDADVLAIVDKAFNGRNELELGKYDPSFSEAWSEVGAKLQAWRSQSGMWDVVADLRTVLSRVFGVVLAVVGLGAAFGSAFLAADRGEGWLWATAVGGLLAGAGVAMLVRAWELHVRTPQGTAMWLRVESFRRFLAESEAYHAEEAAKRGVLREYTAWAVAVGEIKRWSKAVAAATIAPAAASAAHWAYIGPGLTSATSSTSTEPSSSSSGGGGGVGGGAGGGGGGSW